MRAIGFLRRASRGATSRRRLTAVLAAVAVTAAACGPGAAPPAGAPNLPDPSKTIAPRDIDAAELESLRFTADTLDGGSVDTAELIGRDPVAFWAWTPWCSSCNREAPTVREAISRHDASIRFVGVPGLDETARMQVFVDRHELGGIPHAIDRDGDLWRRLGVRGQPTWVLVDRSGNVQRLFGLVDAAELDERLREIAARARKKTT